MKPSIERRLDALEQSSNMGGGGIDVIVRFIVAPGNVQPPVVGAEFNRTRLGRDRGEAEAAFIERAASVAKKAQPYGIARVVLLTNDVVLLDDPTKL